LYLEKIEKFESDSTAFIKKEKSSRSRIADYILRHRDQARQREIDLKKLKNSYEEEIKLKAPVGYWNDKKSSSRSGKLLYSGMFLVVFAAIIWIYLDNTIPWLNPLIAEAKAKNKYPIFEIAVFVSITAFSFWILRIFARLALSAHHLQIDAEERSVMIQTYLALIKEGAVSDKEREIILTPIFKPTADGIVKEDPQMELPLTALLRNRLG